MAAIRIAFFNITKLQNYALNSDHTLYDINNMAFFYVGQVFGWVSAFSVLHFSPVTILPLMPHIHLLYLQSYSYTQNKWAKPEGFTTKEILFQKSAKIKNE